MADVTPTARKRLVRILKESFNIADVLVGFALGFGADLLYDYVHREYIRDNHIEYVRTEFGKIATFNREGEMLWTKFAGDNDIAKTTLVTDSANGRAQYLVVTMNASPSPQEDHARTNGVINVYSQRGELAWTYSLPDTCVYDVHRDGQNFVYRGFSVVQASPITSRNELCIVATFNAFLYYPEANVLLRMRDGAQRGIYWHPGTGGFQPVRFRPDDRTLLLFCGVNNGLKRFPESFGLESYPQNKYPNVLALIDPDSIEGDAPLAPPNVDPNLGRLTGKGAELWYLAMPPLPEAIEKYGPTTLRLVDEDGDGVKEIIWTCADQRIYSVDEHGNTTRMLVSDNATPTRTIPRLVKIR